ncbi:GNAT family N-acetyltransferase [Pseudoalteromonas luteoviolacea]|uniref:GNAT family N-acetyltransferase n=1 Tax=Pseudoalteromonas luteoviolacea TaxID=43657 RepID=UPI001EED295A|nr:GNAT family N-acetyltransferase [Pseudoalteromonas luteoviolacea]MCF6440144.1 GNAT family N-acetyltransferase [Pseudoalteromonas luteoviolacea]
MQTYEATPLLPNDKQHKLLAMEIQTQHLCDNTLHHIENTANQNRNTKVLLQVKESNSLALMSNGYQIEATIPKLYCNEDAIFAAKYLDSQRKIEENSGLYDEILEHVISNTDNVEATQHNTSMARLANRSDARGIAKLFANDDTLYSHQQEDEPKIKASMQGEHEYVVIDYLDNIVAAVNIKHDAKTKSCFVQDLSVASFVQSQGMATTLIDFVLDRLLRNDVKTIHCQCIADDYAMNKVLARHEFNFGGRLTNQIIAQDQLHSVNMWSKKLLKDR